MAYSSPIGNERPPAFASSPPIFQILDGGRAIRTGQGRPVDAVVRPNAAYALDAMGDGVFILRRDGGLEHVNRAGQTLIDARDALHLHHGRVEAYEPAERTRFAEMIGAAADRGEIGALSLRTASGGRINVTMAPADTSGAVLMLAARVRREESSVLVQLVKAFGLTRAEADVARAIGAGDGPAEIAAARQASLSTVQSQLKTIASKLGCHRQSEIAAVVQAMPRLR